MAAYRRVYVTCTLTAKNRDQLLNPTLGNRVWATFTFFVLVRGSRERKGRGSKGEWRGKGVRGDEVEGEGST